MPNRERDIDIWSDVYRLLPSWTWETTPDYRLSYIQSSVTDLTGIDMQALIGFEILDEAHEGQTGANSEAYIAALRARQPIQCIAYDRVLLNGVKTVLVDNAAPRFDAEGRFLGYRGVSINLSEILRRADDTESLVKSLQSRADHLEQTLSQRNAELQATNDLLSGVVEAMGEGLMVTSGTDVCDPDNRILLVNKAYRRLFGLGPEDVHEDMRVSDFAELLEARNLFGLAGGNVQDMSAELAKGDNVLAEIPALNKHYSVRATSGPSGGYVLVHTDVTELQTKNAALRSARDAAEVASRAKSNFLATMSHEIRTPMNGIVGMAGLLAECDLPPDAVEYVRTIRNAAMSLTHLISDILDFSKIEAGHLVIGSECFDPRALVSDMRDLMGPMATGKGLVLRCDVDAAVPETLQGDPLRLRQILLNLLGNAVKFTLSGQVRLEMLAQDGIHIRVSDTGIGIPEADLPQIFNAFQQVQGGRERQFEGTGLGLSITRQLVDAMQGRIEVSSRLGDGTVFDLWLPLPAGQGPVPAPAPLPSQDLDLTGVRVLVVEDNRTNQMVVSKMLANRGALVTLAADGQDAVERYGPGAFDIVFMDVSMPVMTGLEATRHIRKIETRHGWMRTPIVALTGNVQAQDQNEALAAGMDAFLSKPVQREDLLRVIALHVPELCPDCVQMLRSG